jgi:hypothetical protein
MPRPQAETLTNMAMDSEDKQAANDTVTMRKLAPTLRWEGVLLAEMAGTIGNFADVPAEVLLLGGDMKAAPPMSARPTPVASARSSPQQSGRSSPSHDLQSPASSCGTAAEPYHRRLHARWGRRRSGRSLTEVDRQAATCIYCGA